MQTVMVGWRKGLASFAHTYAVEVAGGSIWLGRLGKGGAYWEPRPGLSTYTMNSIGQSIPEQTAGVKLGLAAGGKALSRFRAEIEACEERYRSGGRAALAGDKHTKEWPLADVGDAKVVDALPGGAPPAMKAMGPRFVEVRLGGKPHFFAGLPGAASAEEFHAGLTAALSGC